MHSSQLPRHAMQQPPPAPRNSVHAGGSGPARVGWDHGVVQQQQSQSGRPLPPGGAQDTKRQRVERPSKVGVLLKMIIVDICACLIVEP